MGCGGSKEEVATGNTTAVRKVSSNNNNKNTAVVETTTTVTATVVVEKTEIENGKGNNVAAPAEVKDIAENSAAREEGKLISKDSPDRYFSSRKDEVEAEIIAGGYHTPLAEDNMLRAGGSGAKKEVEGSGNGDGVDVEVAAKAGEETKMEEEKGGAVEEIAVVDGTKTAPTEEEQNGAAESKESAATMKEPTPAVAAEETKAEIATAEQEKNGESEITAEPALAQ